jgi:hypothetical protein
MPLSIDECLCLVIAWDAPHDRAGPPGRCIRLTGPRDHAYQEAITRGTRRYRQPPQPRRCAEGGTGCSRDHAPRLGVLAGCAPPTCVRPPPAIKPTNGGPRGDDAVVELIRTELQGKGQPLGDWQAFTSTDPILELEH